MPDSIGHEVCTADPDDAWIPAGESRKNLRGERRSDVRSERVTDASFSFRGDASLLARAIARGSRALARNR
jgi:hypothetical protein